MGDNLDFSKMFDIYTANHDEVLELIKKIIKYTTTAENFLKVLDEVGFPFNMVDKKFDIERYVFALPYLRKRLECKHPIRGEFFVEDYNPHSGHNYNHKIVYCNCCLLKLN